MLGKQQDSSTFPKTQVTEIFAEDRRLHQVSR